MSINSLANYNSPYLPLCQGWMGTNCATSLPFSEQERSPAGWKQTCQHVNLSEGTYSRNWVRMSRQRLEALPCFHIPYPHAFVKLRIRREIHQLFANAFAPELRGNVIFCYHLALTHGLTGFTVQELGITASLKHLDWLLLGSEGNFHLTPIHS